MGKIVYVTPEPTPTHLSLVHSIVTMRVTRVCVLLFCIIASFTSLLASPALLREFILNDHSSENCGTQNSLCGTDYTPDCCPHLSCSEVDEFWICDIEKKVVMEKNED